MLLGEGHVGLLVAVRSDEGVHLSDGDAVELLASLADGGLGGALVNDEDERVVVLNRLDGALSAEGVLHDSVHVPSRLLLEAVHLGLGVAALSQSLGQTEGNLGPDLGLLGSVRALLHVLSNLLSLLIQTEIRWLATHSSFYPGR